MIYINKGLDLPIKGNPDSDTVDNSKHISSVALLGVDYVGVKPKLCVAVGDKVEIGTPLWQDKANHMLAYTSPGGGVVSAIHRGHKRALLSVVIDIDAENEASVEYKRHSEKELKKLSATDIRAQLQNSGMWSAFRTRPFGHVPQPNAKTNIIFINAMDTNPLAADPALIVNSVSRDAFERGCEILAKLCGDKLYVCRQAGKDIPIPDEKKICLAEFAGPHPAGLSSTHIHHLAPVNRDRSVWTINYQDVIACAHLFTEGRLMVERTISMAGPMVKRPRLMRVRLGADLNALCVSELERGDNRVISGSVLSGRNARGAVAYLGRHHLQVSALEEGTKRELFGWMSMGAQKHSNMLIYLHGLSRSKDLLSFDTSTNGSERAMVPTGNYERVMPLDIEITMLLRYLIVGDVAMAEKLGCLELDEEDLGLCSYVCSGKYEYAHILRSALERIWHDG